MINKQGDVREEDGISDRRWVLVTDDGAVFTLGRATDPNEAEIARVEEALSARGAGGWLAIQSHSFHRSRHPKFVAVRRLGQEGISFDDAVAAAIKAHLP